MSEELALRHILAVEDGAGLAEFVCPETGVPLWALVRSVFIHLVMADKLYGSGNVAADRSTGALGGASRMRMARLIAQAFLHNARLAPVYRGSSPVVVMASGARLVLQDGNYFNCLGDYFVSVAPESTLLVEEMFKWRWPFPRRHRKTLLHTPLRVIGALQGKRHAAKHRAASAAMVEQLCARSNALLGFDLDSEQRAWLAGLCAEAAGSLPARLDAYTALFKRAGARLLVKEEACYGGPDNVSAIVAARRLGMVTAEYQHGSVSSGHSAYNFGAEMAAWDAFRATLPEYFLSYGAWWSSQVNAPVRHVVIGSPHRSAVVRPGASPSAARRILILGDGIETAAYLALAGELAAKLGDGFEVVFRPHPLERAAVLASHGAQAAGAVKLDQNQDMYHSFQTCSAVVSEVSTGLFEAVGLVRNIFIWDTPKSRFSYPQHPFYRFASADQLAHAVLDGKGAVSDEQNDQIWSPGWDARYAQFLRTADVGLAGT